MTSQTVNAAGLRHFCFAKAQLAILFAELIERLLFRLHAIGALDGAEMLQAVDHDKREEQGDGGSEDAHLVHAHGVGGLDEARVVKVLGKADFGRADAAAARGLLRQQEGVMLGDATRSGRCLYQSRLWCMPPWFHLCF